MRGCSRYRGRLLSGGARTGTPAEALDLARHLASCPGCSRESARLDALERELERLPEIEVPGSFSRRVMEGLRRAAPTALKAGACLLFAALLSVVAAVSGLSFQGAEVLPRLPWESAETFGNAALGFGRAVVVLLSCALRPSASPVVTGAGRSFHAPLAAASALLVAGLFLLILGVVVSNARARCHDRR